MVTMVAVSFISCIERLPSCNVNNALDFATLKHRNASLTLLRDRGTNENLRFEMNSQLSSRFMG